MTAQTTNTSSTGSGTALLLLLPGVLHPGRGPVHPRGAGSETSRAPTGRPHRFPEGHDDGVSAADAGR